MSGDGRNGWRNRRRRQGEPNGGVRWAVALLMCGASVLVGCGCYGGGESNDWNPDASVDAEVDAAGGDTVSDGDAVGGDTVGGADTGADTEGDACLGCELGGDECNGEDTNGDGKWSVVVPRDCPSIQKALDAAADSGSTGSVHVRPGTYTENLRYNGAAVTVRAITGPEGTTIDGSSEEAATVTFADDEGADSVLEGFRVTGGRGNGAANDSTRGGGIHVKEASPTLRRLVVADNAVTADSGYGGGIQLTRSRASLQSVTVVGNEASYYGGGISISQSGGATLRNVAVIDNKATYGGGMTMAYDGPTATNLLVLENAADFGAGLMIQSAAPTIENAAFHKNTGDAIHLLSEATPEFANVTVTGSTGWGVNAEEGDADFFYCNVWGNEAGGVTGDDAPASSEGNLSKDPAFVDASGRHPRKWDLHLTSGSPLVDAGDPELKDPDGSRSDIGAYGGPAADQW